MQQNTPISDDAPMAPIFISSMNRHIVVFGGGKVALRKCTHFKGFDMTVIAETVLPEIREIVSEVIERRFDEDDASTYMEDADMVIVATDSMDLNESIRDIAMSLGIPTNSAHGGGDVLIPSTLRRDGYTVTVSTGGRASAFPPYVVKRIDGFLGDEYDLMLRLITRLRTEIRNRIGTQPERAAFLAAVLEDEGIWDLLRSGDTDSAYARAEGMIG